MATIDMHEAKTQLSDLVARAEAGEEIVIARDNRPAVRLVPVPPDASAPRRERRPGALAARLDPEELARLREFAKDIDWFEHAPDEYISKEAIAAYYRKYPHEWQEMRAMVGVAEDSQSGYVADEVMRARDGSDEPPA
jgi:prevent-host-death family protein